MIALHSTKINGRWYRAGEVIPDGNETVNSEIDAEQSEQHDIVAVIKEKYNITAKSDIALMRKDELVRMATDYGIHDASEKSAADLKKVMVKELGY